MDGIVVDEKKRVEEDDVGERGSRRRAIEDGLGRKTRDEKAAAEVVLSNIKQRSLFPVGLLDSVGFIMFIICVF